MCQTEFMGYQFQPMPWILWEGSPLLWLSISSLPTITHFYLKLNSDLSPELYVFSTFWGPHLDFPQAHQT